MASDDSVSGHALPVVGFVSAAASQRAGLVDASLVNAHVSQPSGDEQAPRAPDLKDQLGLSLMAACEEGAVARVVEALRAGADIEYKDEHGRTPAMIACFKGHKEVLRELMSRGFDQLAVDARGNSMEHYLAHFGHGSDEQLARQAAHNSLMIIKRIRETGRA